jgi:hypothetical protein
MLSKLAYLTLCRSIQLLALVARGDAAKDLEIVVLRPWGAEIHSCSSLVLVQETAEQIVSVYPAFASLMDRVRAGGCIRRSKPERPMRPMNVVMLDVDAQHLLQVSASHDQ